MNKKYLRYASLLLFFFQVNQCFGQQQDIDTVINRVVNNMLAGHNTVTFIKTVTQNVANLKSDGTWADINYRDTALAIWSPAAHLNRVYELALAYAQTKGVYSRNETLHVAIVKALQAWNQLDPKCKNWWFNEINCPQTLGQIMLLLKSSKPLPKPLQDSLITKMNRGDMYKQTGANKFDVALHNIYSALLTANIVLMDSAVSQCFQPLTLTNAPEGLMYDYSYLQHGRQLQIASYGLVFLKGEYGLAALVRGTNWQMKPPQRKLLAKFLNDVFLNAMRYKYLDFNVMGRNFSRKNSLSTNVAALLQKDMDALQKADKETLDDVTGCLNAARRISGKVPASFKVKPVHQQYWIGDYTQHVNPDYLFTVRANSARTKRLETGNGENLYGRYMGDGATNIQRSGGEYFNIFPVWENDKVPGVTCRDFAIDRHAVNSWDQTGTTNFTGGLSNGTDGVCTYTLNFDSVKAKKAWFFFGKEIICMGAGIQSRAPENITTTVNQCWSHTDVLSDSLNGTFWQDSIAYYFQPDEKIKYTNTEQKGTWKRINSSQSADTVKGKVFKLWIDHGPLPHDATYVYAVLPGVPLNQVSSLSPFNHLKVISNNDEQQAIIDLKTGMAQIVFYQPGTIKTEGFSVSVNEACVIMIEKKGTAQQSLFVADPSHQLKEIVITVNNKRVSCVLPIGEYAGSTAIVAL
ncbi:chondroitin AC lyase [Mucilaginibacter gracilis]|uniref:Chondroitin AC lyase n=1 Tax=Mucilaginibacter gracilis TaxID=423350 RepID=A0A495IUG0_9SPHI|nr:polysaccharide lyase family 8 super-sandwich domain-containing protein [Mucilaginibacter gracilis]RKR80387.1 chondroitin AC lyase [Mucilaginibacter gracilis]